MITSLLKIKAIGIISALIVYALMSDYSEYLIQAILQALLFSIIACYSSSYSKNYLNIEYEPTPELCLTIGLIVAFVIAFIKFINTIVFYQHYRQDIIHQENFDTNTSCPDLEDLIKDSDCASNPNDVPQDEEIINTNRFLRTTRQIIASTEDYLNVSRPDERWASKEEMEEHEKTNI